MRRFGRSMVAAALTALAAAGPGTAQDGSAYARPTAEEALAFLRTLPPVGRKVDGKPQMVQLWQDKTVADVKSMKSLQFGGHVQGGAHLRMKGEDWRFLTAFESLEEANLWEIDGADDRAFFHLGHLSATVTKIFVEQAEVTDEGVRHLQGLKNLRFAGIGWTKSITDEALRHLAGIPSLEEINVSGCPGIAGPGLKHLASLPKLKTLHLNDPGFGDEGLAHLAPLGIETLHMTKPPAWAKKPYKIGFPALKALLSDKAALPNLKTLNLKNAVTAAQAAELMALRPGLKVAEK